MQENVDFVENDQKQLISKGSIKQIFMQPCDGILFSHKNDGEYLMVRRSADSTLLGKVEGQKAKQKMLSLL